MKLSQEKIKKIPSSYLNDKFKNNESILEVQSDKLQSDDNDSLQQNLIQKEIRQSSIMFKRFTKKHQKVFERSSLFIGGGFGQNMQDYSAFDLTEQTLQDEDDDHIENNKREHNKSKQSNFVESDQSMDNKDSSQLNNSKKQTQIQGKLSIIRQSLITPIFANQSRFSTHLNLRKRLTLTDPQLYDEIQQENQAEYDNIKEDISSKIPQKFAWLILIYFAINGAVIPPWILSTPAEKYIRNAWRFLMQAIFLIPFIMFERRTGNARVKQQYTLQHIFNPIHLKSIFLSSFLNSLWITGTLFTFEWSYVSHGINLSSLQLFFLSLQRKKENQHSYEIPGQFMIIIGILLTITDSMQLTQENANPDSYGYLMTKYLYRPVWQRVIFGNTVALLMSYIMTRGVATNQKTNSYYPPHLRNFIIFLFNTINLTFSSYFFSGSNIFDDTRWGWFGLFSNTQFSSYMYMSLILGLGAFISSAFLVKLFEPIDIQTAQSFEPIIATVLINIAGVQHLPGSFACIGYVFIIPGLFFINLGQYLIQKQTQIQAIVQEMESKQHIKSPVTTPRANQLNS